MKENVSMNTEAVCHCGEYVRDHNGFTDPPHSPVVMEEPPVVMEEPPVVVVQESPTLHDARKLLREVFPGNGIRSSGINPLGLGYNFNLGRDIIRISTFAEGLGVEASGFRNALLKTQADLNGWVSLVRTRMQEKAVKVFHLTVLDPDNFVSPADLPGLLDAVASLDAMGLSNDDIFAEMPSVQYLWTDAYLGQRHYVTLKHPNASHCQCGSLCVDYDGDGLTSNLNLRFKDHPLTLTVDRTRHYPTPSTQLIKIQTTLIRDLLVNVLDGCRKHNAKQSKSG